MSLYSILFGKNPQSAMLLAVLGIKEHEVPRFRDVHLDERKDRTLIALYTRMGGGNRGHWDGYEGDGGPDCTCPGCRAEHFLEALPGYLYDEDDDFDSTYATYYFEVPAEWRKDVQGLGDILQNGLRAKFGRFLAKTLRREPTEADKEDTAYEAERAAIARTDHFMANGHTFVPKDDGSMKTALELAEANGGKLRTCWGILPITIKVETNKLPYPNSKEPGLASYIDRVDVNYDFRWSIDEEYWRHCQERFGDEFPLTMAKIAEDVERHRAKAA